MSSTLSVCMLSSDEDEKENENTNVVDDDNEGNSSSVEESADEDDASDAYNLEEPENNDEVKSVEDTDSEAETAELTIDVPDSKLIQANLVVSEAKTFSELGLSRWVCEQLRQLSVKLPTPVQANCIPHILAGSDVLGCAKTGTGKTLAFALPILNQLAVDPFGIYALVLTPTRELAFQIAEQFVALGARIGLKTTVIVGGRDQVEQAKNLARRPHIVVATPGRLADHISSEPEGIAKLFKKMHFLVLDEADRLLDGQYGEQLKTIFSALSTKRQTLLFSATINSALNHLQQVSVRKPYLYEDKSEVATVDRLDQKYVLCPNAVKDAYLVYVVKNFHQNRPDSSILIFSHTCRECQALAIMFTGLGFQVGSLHSQISQQERLSSLIRFRCGRIRILICTDVAARGLDIPHVDLVVNHNVPRSPKTYVHRVGRSARAGRFGGAITFVTQYDITLLHEVEKLVGKKLDKLNVPDKKVTQYVTQVLVTKREAEVKLDQQNFGERKRINKRKAMLLEGLDPEEVDEKLREEHTKRKARNQHQQDAVQRSYKKEVKKIEKLAKGKKKC